MFLLLSTRRSNTRDRIKASSQGGLMDAMDATKCQLGSEDH
jgi:hypothetical protein